MSTYLTGVTYAQKRVTPSDDGAAFASVVADGISSGCAMSASGSNLTIAAGKIIACGRTQRVTASTVIAVNEQTSGYARLVLTIDKSKSAAQQVALDVEYAQTVGGFGSLQQDDINGSGTKYQTVLCLMSLSASGISAILWKIGPAHGKGLGKTVTLDKDDWSVNSPYTQTVYVDGVTANGNVIVTYTIADKVAFQTADIDCAAQGNGTLTFSATNKPSADIDVAVLLM